ncbi:hypothetical protein [Pedobacter sp. GR22-6]|uniref:hypothetical protein n=1 Tax=Pedobacter sp. GR22-6 TaxID=3127957 RepID=UPI00307DA113
MITSFWQSVGSDEENEINRVASTRVDKPEIFTAQGKNGFYTWTLKPEILSTYLYSFLKGYYEDMYGNKRSVFKEDCKAVLDFLATQPTDTEIWKFLEDDWHDVLNVSSEHFFSTETLCLSCEGKVFFEEMDMHIDFFVRAIRKAYSDNPLGGCLDIYVY